jgi:tRNA G18 (ribose-2'-O)-methylase SpoU
MRAVSFLGSGSRLCEGSAMAAAIPVDDPEDPRLADYAALADPEFRQRVEAERGFFVVESVHAVRRLLESGRGVRSVLVTPTQLDALREALDGTDAPVYVAPIDVLRNVVGFDLHRGAVACATRWELPAAADVLRGTRRVVVCEGLNDHENLGVLFRNAAALGMDAVVLDAESADPFYRRCVRVSIGHVCTVPWTRFGALPDVRAAGLSLVALTPAPDAISIDDVDWPARTALMFGAEGPGLSDDALAAADLRVRIPMRAGVDSLNIASAAAIAFHAATRAR